MSAHEHLNPVQFSTMHSTEYRLGATYAHDGPALDENGQRRHDNLIGQLSWGTEGKPSEISRIWVHPDHRRQGLATAMLHVARGEAGEVNHSDIRTRKGEAWATSLGAPPRKEIGNWRIHAEFGEMADPGWEEDWHKDRMEAIYGKDGN